MDDGQSVSFIRRFHCSYNILAFLHRMFSLVSYRVVECGSRTITNFFEWGDQISCVVVRRQASQNADSAYLVRRASQNADSAYLVRRHKMLTQRTFFAWTPIQKGHAESAICDSPLASC